MQLSCPNYVPTDHPLCDVRSRALRSVSFKLSNGLVCAEELARERQFLIGLLEWFNFEEWTCQTQVLELLLQLIQARSTFIIVDLFLDNHNLSLDGPIIALKCELFQMV